MKKILWFAGLYLLLGTVFLVWRRRKEDPDAPIWAVPTGDDWESITLWPLKLLELTRGPNCSL